MGGNKHKQAKVALTPPAGKSARIGPANPDQFEDARLTWRFRLMDMDGCAWSWSNADGPTFAKVISKLKDYESLSWKEIAANRSNHSGQMPMAKLCSDAQDRLEALRLEDHEVLWKLACGGPARVWGVRDRGIFYVLWWDPLHKVYPMNITDN